MDCQLTFKRYCNLQINDGTYSAVKSISLILALTFTMVSPIYPTIMREMKLVLPVQVKRHLEEV